MPAKTGIARLTRTVDPSHLQERACARCLMAEFKAKSGRSPWAIDRSALKARASDRKSTRLNSSHPSISYAVFCSKKNRSPTQYDHLSRRHARNSSEQDTLSTPVGLTKTGRPSVGHCSSELTKLASDSQISFDHLD